MEMIKTEQYREAALDDIPHIDIHASRETLVFEFTAKFP